MRYDFYTADVFTDEIFGGNPLAVFPEATGLEVEQMQRVAAEFNLSETVFVLPPDNAVNTRRLRIFTPRAEIPFAGHPTVGTAFVLATTGRLSLDGPTTEIVLEEGVGPVPVTIESVGGKITACHLSAARMPVAGPPPPPIDKLAAMLSVAPDDLLDGEFAPQSLSCGIPFLFIAARNRKVIGKLQLDSRLWKELLADYWTREVFCLALDPELPGSDVRARMFAPAHGIEEDPATGSAATALAGFLGARDPRDNCTLRWVVEQGFEMGRPSILKVEADKRGGETVAIRVGGSSVMVSEGTMEIPA